jgi:hypothetical protein
VLSFVGIAAALAALSSRALVQQQDGRIPLDSATWEISGEGSRIEQYKGVRALRMRTGRAINRKVRMRDGTIEYDMEVTPNRSFVYATFRMQSEEESEEIYFRPHKSSLPDAFQYTPTWNGESTWQLYHGPGSTAAVPLPRGEWIHVRLVVSGRHAAMFLGEEKKPALVMTLAREPAEGYVGLQAFTPVGGAPKGEMVAAFANVVVRPDHVPYDFGPETVAAKPAGLIDRWQISPPYVARLGAPLTTLPDSLMKSKARWPTFAVEPTGVVVLSRHVKRTAEQTTAIARLLLRAEREGVQPLRLGFSDYVTVFANDRPLFAGDAHYSFDAPRQEGLIGLSQSTVWLPLVRGENEILFVLSDTFGGWGLIAQLDPASGVEVVATPPR